MTAHCRTCTCEPPPPAGTGSSDRLRRLLLDQARADVAAAKRRRTSVRTEES